MPTNERPLSPHLQVYRPQITSLTSITHRATGIALAAGMLLLVYWLYAASAGQADFAALQGFLATGLGRLLLFGWTFSIFYHLCNGIRHLFWDAGRGFELSTVRATGWLVIVAALALTVLSWVWGYSKMGVL